jgi:hypothetical protein
MCSCVYVCMSTELPTSLTAKPLTDYRRRNTILVMDIYVTHRLNNVHPLADLTMDEWFHRLFLPHYGFSLLYRQSHT